MAAAQQRWLPLCSIYLPRFAVPLPLPLPLPLPCPGAGEAINLRGARVVGHLHGPAVVGQAAVFSHYVEDCRSRLHTGKRRCCSRHGRPLAGRPWTSPPAQFSWRCSTGP